MSADLSSSFRSTERRASRPAAVRLCSAPRALIAALALGLFGAGASCSGRAATSRSGPTPAASAFQEAVDAYFAGFFQRSPVSASHYGEHSLDHAWPDLSSAARAEYGEWLTSMSARLDAVGTATLRESGGGLTVDQQVDLSVLANEIRGALFSLRVERPFETNPLAYAYLIGGGLNILVDRDYAPVAERGAALAKRLEGVPALVEQAIANLSDPAIIKAPQAKVAVRQFGGIKTLIETLIPERTAEAPADVQARIAAAAPAAQAAVAKLAAHVQALVPKATGAWRLGAEAFADKLEMTLQAGMSAAQVYELAQAEHRRVRQRMHALATELHEPLFGSPPTPGALTDGADHALIRKVLDALARDHVDAADLRDACEENLTRIAAFVRAENIVPMDDKEVLEVIWTPPHERGVAIAGLDAPPPLDAEKPGLPSYYLVQPVPEDWSVERRESFLREYNHFMLEILSIHEAIPGHFVQLYYGKRDPSKVRKVFESGPFVEGWAVYTEKVMVDEGYVGQKNNIPPNNLPAELAGLWRVKRDDQLRAKAIALHGQKFYLRGVTNAILDHDIHAGDMTEEQAVSFMMERAFQEEGEARAKWVRAQVTSTQLSTYFVGATAWFRIREQAEKRAKEAGQAFDTAAFHSQALSHGAPPLVHLPRLMGW